MLDTQSPKTQFSTEVDDLADEDYRPLSGWAVIALLVALLSVTAAISPLLWVLPIVALTLSLNALWQLSRPDSIASGKSLAVLGLLITMLVSGFAPARLLSRQNQLNGQATVNALAWLELLVQDRVLEAHQLSLEHMDRFSGNMTLDEYYSDAVDPTMRKRLDSTERSEEMEMMRYAMETGMADTPSQKLKRFREGDTVSHLLALPDETQFELVRSISQTKYNRRLRVLQQFVARYTDDAGQPQAFYFLLRSTRKPGVVPGDMHWQVEEADSVPSLQADELNSSI